MSAATVNVEEVAKDWRSRGFHCELWEDVPGHQWCDCLHETDELFMVIEGDIEIEVEGEKIRPEPGQEIMIDAGKYHTVRNVGDVQTRWLHGCWLDFAQTD